VDLNRNFRWNLEQVLIDRKLPRRVAAEMCGISGSHLDHIMRDETGTTLLLVGKICEGLKLDPGAMIDE